MLNSCQSRHTEAFTSHPRHLTPFNSSSSPHLVVAVVVQDDQQAAGDAGEH